MTIALVLAALMNSATIILHYHSTMQMGPAINWLPSLALQILFLPAICYLIWWGSFELIGYLSTVEGRYWGYRMHRSHVRRAIQYVVIHLPMVSLLPLSIVCIYCFMISIQMEFGLYMLQYLYVLSGASVICAIYLFKIYWIAMKAMLYGNPAEVVEMSHVSASGNPTYNS